MMQFPSKPVPPYSWGSPLGTENFCECLVFHPHKKKPQDLQKTKKAILLKLPNKSFLLPESIMKYHK